MKNCFYEIPLTIYLKETLNSILTYLAIKNFTILQIYIKYGKKGVDIPIKIGNHISWSSEVKVALYLEDNLGSNEEYQTISSIDYKRCMLNSKLKKLNNG